MRPGGPMGRGQSTEKAINFSVAIKKLIKHGKNHFRILIFSSFLATVASILSIIGPNKISELIDVIIKGLTTGIDFNQIKSIGLFLFVIYFISSLISLVQNNIMAKTSNKFAKKLRTDLSEKINRLPLKYFDNNSYGDVLSRITNDVDTINQSFQNSIITLISSTSLIVAAIFMMYYTNWIMATTVIITTIISFSLMAFIMKKSQKYFAEKQAALGDLNGHIEEIYSNHNIVKAYNGKADSDLKFDKLNKIEYNSNRKSQFFSGIMQPIMSFSGDFSYVAVCVIGAILTKNDIITFGVIVAFILYVRIFTGPLRQIAMGLTQMQSAAAASERVFVFLEEQEMPPETNLIKTINKTDAKGNIEFKNVQFGYEKDELVIKDFSVKITAGEKIAIVGPTGAGKTTLVNLLMKFYDINDGDILIDGISIKEIRRENIHALFIMVLQDTWLFSGTIRENLIYNQNNISDKEINSICSKIGLDHFIKTTNNGLDHVINDTNSISSGQKQLMTIARGMLSDAPLLILDEATSNVDTRTEELVQKAMDKLTEGRTSFIIAHRLSTIKNADLILVMDHGNIIEQGTHEELLKSKGFYFDLYNSQFSRIT